MSSDYTALLALDSMTSENMLKVAVYERAVQLHQLMARKIPIEEIASRFLEFAKGERWRLAVLDTVFLRVDRKTTLDRIIEYANEAAEWIDPKPDPSQAQPTKPKRSKKDTTRKR